MPPQKLYLDIGSPPAWYSLQRVESGSIPEKYQGQRTVLMASRVDIALAMVTEFAQDPVRNYLLETSSRARASLGDMDTWALERIAEGHNHLPQDRRAEIYRQEMPAQP